MLENSKGFNTVVIATLEESFRAITDTETDLRIEVVSHNEMGRRELGACVAPTCWFETEMSQKYLPLCSGGDGVSERFCESHGNMVETKNHCHVCILTVSMETVWTLHDITEYREGETRCLCAEEWLDEEMEVCTTEGSSGPVDVCRVMSLCEKAGELSRCKSVGVFLRGALSLK